MVCAGGAIVYLGVAGLGFSFRSNSLSITFSKKSYNVIFYLLLLFMLIQLMTVYK